VILTVLDLYNIKKALDHIMTDRRVNPAVLKGCETTLGKIEDIRSMVVSDWNGEGGTYPSDVCITLVPHQEKTT